MSIGLDCLIEVKKNGKWEEHKFVHREPLAYDYAVFSYDAIAFLTGFKNDCKMPTIGEDKFYRGYPKDSDWLNELVDPTEPEHPWNPTVREHISNDNDYAISYVTLKELLDFDYDQEFENLANPNFNMSSNAELRDERRSLPNGEGFKDTVRNCIGKSFFHAIEYLKELGEPENVRVIYNLS